MKLDGIQLDLNDLVYEPREDTFMFIDTLKDEPIGSILEIGSGSGAIILSLAAHSPGQFYVATDLNYLAALQTQQNSIKNGLSINCVATSYAFPFRYKGLPETIVFNPPYLPSDPPTDKFLTPEDRLALIGGDKGYESLIKAIDLLSFKTLYSMVSSLAVGISKFKQMLKERGINVIILDEKKFSFETLWLVKLVKINVI